MTSKQTRLIALLLAASLFMNNTILPVKATEVEENTIVSETTTETTIESTIEGTIEATTDATIESTIEDIIEATTDATLVTDTLQSEVTEPTDITDSTDKTETTVETDSPDDTDSTEKSFSIAIDKDETLRFYVGMPEEEFQTIVQYYASLPPLPGQMPLEWWFAVCDKVVELRACLTIRLEQEAKAEKKNIPAESQTITVTATETEQNPTIKTEIIEDTLVSQ